VGKRGDRREAAYPCPTLVFCEKSVLGFVLSVMMSAMVSGGSSAAKGSIATSSRPSRLRVNMMKNKRDFQNRQQHNVNKLEDQINKAKTINVNKK
jgi:hypothetical protein